MRSKEDQKELKSREIEIREYNDQNQPESISYTQVGNEGITPGNGIVELFEERVGFRFECRKLGSDV